MSDRDNEISLNKQVKFKDLKIMLVKIMKYAVIYFMIYTSPNEIQVKTGQLTCYFQHHCCTRDIQAPFFKLCNLTPAGWRKVPIGCYSHQYFKSVTF